MITGQQEEIQIPSQGEEGISVGGKYSGWLIFTLIVGILILIIYLNRLERRIENGLAGSESLFIELRNKTNNLEDRVEEISSNLDTINSSLECVVTGGGEYCL